MMNRRQFIGCLGFCATQSILAASPLIAATEETSGGKADQIRRVYALSNTSHFGATELGGMVEIGALESLGGRLTGRVFHSLINANCDIEPVMFDEHGYTRDAICHAPKFAAIAEDLIGFIRAAELITTEQREIDWLNLELARQRRPPIPSVCCRVIKTFDLYRETFIEQPYEQVRVGLRLAHGIYGGGLAPGMLRRVACLAHAHSMLMKNSL